MRLQGTEWVLQEDVEFAVEEIVEVPVGVSSIVEVTCTTDLLKRPRLEASAMSDSRLNIREA